MTNLLLSELSSKIRGFHLFVVMSLISFTAFAQNTITGTVTDENGPVPGVTVMVKGTSNGVVTDFDGNYAINNVPSDGVLVFSFVGFQTKEEPVNGQSEINTSLETDVSSLDEVVVVGYGTMKRSDVTGAVVSVSEEAIEESIPTTVDQVLQGRAAGVQIQQNSGAPGASSSIRIRGISSVTGTNEPIFVIDGVIVESETGSTGQNAFASINPSDIVSIDILKDASATAIYGSRAANGVILITTKRGQNGEATINLNSYVGFQELPNQLDMLTLREYAIHKNTRAELDIVQQDPFFIRPELLGEGTDWQDEMFTRAMMQSHNLSVSGGNEKTNYALSIGYLDQEGIALGSDFDRLNLRGTFDSQVKDYLKTGITFAFNTINQTTTFSEQSLILTALRQTPNVAVRNAEGTFDGPVDDEFTQNNPVGLASIRENRSESAGIRANTFAEIEFVEGLKLRSEYSIDYGVSNNYTFNPSYQFGAIINSTREGSRTKSYNKYYNFRNVLTYDRSFGDHGINAILGQEYQQTYWENLYGYRSGYLTNGATDLDAGDPSTARNGNTSVESALSSYFARTFYSFDDKYLLTATLRYDGSSKFAESNRWGWFPSAALAWKISNEEFLQDNEYINNLKLRLGYGAVGNQYVPNFAYTSIYGASATPFGAGLLATNTANEDLEWETTYSGNIGLDLNMFNNRLEFIADVYYKKTDNLLLRAPYPDYSGTTGVGATTAPFVNIGSLENKGLELTLNTVNVDTGDFSWRTNLVFTLNRNEVLALATDTGILNETLQQGSDVTIVTRTAVGQPIGQFYGYKVIGRFEEATDFYYRNENDEVVPTALPEGMEIGENGVWIGDYIFDDVNEDGVINEQDRDYIGNPHPDFSYGIGNTFKYKGFDLNVQLSGLYGNEVVNYQRRFLENPRENTNLLQSALGYAELGLIDPNGPNDYRNVQIVDGDQYMPRIAASSAASTSNFRYSDRFLEDGSYLRIQNISFGYNFPRDFVEKFGLLNLKLYTNLQNVYTFTNYSGFDPEVGAINQNVLLSGIDNGRYPSPRIYTLGVNVNF
ncbi:SusC/RagA family TonB-linked outer membrane protein [Autumnicola edwardsiae]|uniref:TonB-dependent receptor n=1 Tax=Autumnicola edwardsiae TaxID=3075594 RepID=A0ABU3CQQ1_9FLAO|nr:TonB-dependent receptor [Zunongwangia sp. F297]MDT0648641.1 TonB-dependent receptor [Zunongwangia sp. F297]